MPERPASRRHLVDATAVRAWCDLVGDRNPLHLDDEWAAASAFGHTIVPGHLLAALVADDLARAGSPVAVSLAFRAPVPVGAEVEVSPGGGAARLTVHHDDRPTSEPVAIQPLTEKERP